MSQENPKRPASTSPAGCITPDLKRLRLANDLWPKDEHLRQDSNVKELLGSGIHYDINDISTISCILNMGYVLKAVVTVASEGLHSHLLQAPAAFEYYCDALKDPDLIKLVGDCYTNGSYKDVRCLEFLRKNPDSALTLNSDEDKVVDITSSYAATEKAWNKTYVGTAADCFYDTITGHCTKEDPTVYARYANILQSSGMGKSRMIDELSKKHFVLPINLRPSADSGFPAADVDVRTFLTVDETEKNKALRRSHAFLTALFTIAGHYLQNIDLHIGQLVGGLPPKQQTIAQKFRLLMTAGQTFNQQGDKRRTFYTHVVNYANELLQLPSTNPVQPLKLHPLPAFSREGKQDDIEKTAVDLLKCLNPNLEATDLKTSPPLIVLAFDEAHILSDRKHPTDTGYFSKFSELRRALRALNELPIFSVFLSTAGKIQSITPAAECNEYSRVQNSDLVLLPPFTELGFDQMVTEISDGDLTIEEVSTIKYMARFGRPLFGSRYINGDVSIQKNIIDYAGQKLLGGVPFPRTTKAKKAALTPDAKLACMAVRLALEFNATTLEIQNRERTQVEKYMRVCLVMNPGFETTVAIAPSEPLLAEAAHLLMQDHEAFDLPGALLYQLQGQGLDKGNRGELICLVLLLIARDVAVQEKQDKTSVDIDVLAFMKILLASKWSPIVFKSEPAQRRTNAENQPFSEVFSGSKMYFNHFIKVHDFKVINRAFLWKLIARGAAVLCADNQRGIDVLLPFLYLDNKLGRDNVSGIFIQVKNDNTFSSTPNLFLFDAMNPYFLGFFDTDEQNPVPIIRMVFALAASKSCVKVLEYAPLRKNPSRSAKSKEKTRARLCPAYTAYDIWCAGTSAETFSVVKPSEEEVYSKLLKVSRMFPGVYEADTEIESAKSARRNMNPGTAAHPDHWSQFSIGVTEDKVNEIDVDFDYQDEAVDDDVEMQ